MELTSLAHFVPRFADARILVVGDLMLDHYLSGSVDRISPEAPVPILLVQGEHDTPGGAANVAGLVRAFGTEVIPCGLVGEDAGADSLCQHFKASQIDCQYIVRRRERATMIKTRVVAGRQQIVRIDREDRRPLEDDLLDEIRKSIDRALAGRVDGVIISDYGKGLVVPAIIEHLVSACQTAGLPLAVDPKVEHFSQYRGVTLITPNNKEASEAIGIPIRDRASLEAAGQAIRRAIDPEILLITRSEHGMALFERGQALDEIPTRVQEVFDVTGAGDMVISVAMLALLAGASPREAALLANAAAGLEVRKFGCQPVSPEELLASLKA
jgi:D-beta-D-heptose 7-phosphate kinase/D-beta-D-heptose 1-phosphate adenosyltransferase